MHSRSLQPQSFPAAALSGVPLKRVSCGDDETVPEEIEKHHVCVDVRGCDISYEASLPPLAPPPRGGVGRDCSF